MLSTMFQDCESSLKQKTELVTKLEFKSVGINESFVTLEDKYVSFYFYHLTIFA